MKRRTFTRYLSLLSASASMAMPLVTRAKTYLTIEQARTLLWGDEPLEPVVVTLSDDQQKSIKKASRIRVRQAEMQVWKTANGGWLILDQVIGKHENIDMAFAYTADGKVKGMEILTYRETYGFEVQNPKWRAQFHGKTHIEHLRLDDQIKNISGATLSCRHITDAINRLNHTWEQVLRHL